MDTEEYKLFQVEVNKLICSIIPPLADGNHKGQAGRIGIIGGSREYTGAPYFAALSAMKTGADLSYVFCTSDSSTVIKTYSPELIVLPCLDSKHALEDLVANLPKLHALVVGPGLGRCESTWLVVQTFLTQHAKQRGIPIILDADALFFIAQQPDLIRGYEQAILTPNVAEFERLYASVFKQASNKTDDPKKIVEKLAQSLGNVTILRKGPEDIISNGHATFGCHEKGSLRRCGGQGDLLSGAVATFSHWSQAFCQQNPNLLKNTSYSPTILAALAGSFLVRRCARFAFAKHARSTTASCLMKEIQNAFTSLYPVD